MTDVENAAQFFIEFRFVVKIGILPRDRMALRRLKTAFAHD